ncbi:MAG: hypothetical protein GXP29_09055 [Planctomycetes bacterium]|nr:hypothetical protein [Planctomycetota bacterium]
MLDEGCMVGVCNQVDGMCELAPGNEGVACDDLSLCTDNDVCVGGVCAGAPTDCSSLDTPCSFATCDLGTGLCVAPPAPFDCNSNGVDDECETGLVPDMTKVDASGVKSAGFPIDPMLSGASVAVSGHTIIVGSPGSDAILPCPLGRSDEPCDIFDVGMTNQLVQEFYGPSPPAGEWYDAFAFTFGDMIEGAALGRSVAIDGITEVAGAPGNNINGNFAGSAFINRPGLWPPPRLIPDDTSVLDRFGHSVSISDNVVVIGAYGNDSAGPNSGAAYIFREIVGTGDWPQIAKLTASDAAPEDFFGISVSISGSLAAIGSPRNDDDGFDSGSVYIFQKVSGAWQQITKLTADDASAGDNFGWSVSIDGVTAIVGAYRNDDSGADSGSAYVFRRINGVWQQTAKLSAADASAGDEFGWSVAISGLNAVIGARNDDDGASGSGSGYLFSELNGVWQETLKLVSDNPQTNERLGYSVAIDGSTAVFGAVSSPPAGAAYIFEMPDDCFINGVLNPNCDTSGANSIDCNLNGIPDECDIRDGTSKDCNLNDFPDECEPVAGGDFDSSGRLNLADFRFLADCQAGPGATPAPPDSACANMCLQAFDTDYDGDVDLQDFAEFDLSR